MREVSTKCDSDGIAEADGSLMFPEVLRPVTGEGISARLIVPHVGNVLQGAQVGKDIEGAQELPVNPTRMDMTQGRKAYVVPCLLAYASRYRATLVRTGLEELVDVTARFIMGMTGEKTRSERPRIFLLVTNQLTPAIGDADAEYDSS